MTLALVALASFLIGSVPFGYVVGRAFYRTDIRNSGSGNIGAMNALRTLGKTGAASVLLLDALKGTFSVLLALRFGGAPAGAVAGACAVLGHCFSPWLGWKGGKGVATSFGAIFALSWPAGLVVVLGWVVGALLLTRYSSVGSMLANAVAPCALFLLTHSVPETLFGLFVAIFIVWTHRENIERLRSGTERRIPLFGRKSS